MLETWYLKSVRVRLSNHEWIFSQLRENKRGGAKGEKAGGLRFMHKTILLFLTVKEVPMGKQVRDFTRREFLQKTAAAGAAITGDVGGALVGGAAGGVIGHEVGRH